PSVPFIGGLGGEDLTVELMQQAIAAVVEAGQRTGAARDVIWLVGGQAR
ncbi:MAG TPA: hypothetical protein GX513_02710, partial [Firmicutes bacterium]|nr:hypothetical protein [Bacillota bacterium]